MGLRDLSARIYSILLTARLLWTEIMEKAKRCRLRCEKTVQRLDERAKDRQQAGQEDQILAQIWLQEAPHQKRKRHWTAPDEQPRVRRRARPVPLSQDQVRKPYPPSPFSSLSKRVCFNCAGKPSWPAPRNSTWDWRTLRASWRRSPPSEQVGRTRHTHGETRKLVVGT